ncbi:hypothetical protein EHI8A_107170 [Entamoeba histolytica HM-1:IMSS-B]|uniref:B-block binding subunit of TFIIIC domain-containing protein n=5 Tax=Entamoeba histolytica TaxID=5759 RepID=C4M704_ENTH1|nr:hypothetical protein EHI_057840 [Entamoeba histolytica HM-1:IMSS]EMH74229.1 hypothetical protein EHI8A_107170 [Entamoeba histolytica HM-1:IMSS-B]EMS12312.1 hypothetical protein KM1_175270 [Entamoeba histolytica HM-3:IMSS]ENY62483.1 hypothetical protein EHI7A_098740 [Entamoeba histolytica HM-1:IMSS-A]GAT97292.1 hypothetical protein CL6EHI_057840 [Entamoeba histolytica]EAL46720.1 hypothetical protein EHI_057840 [Entamoeba histolytica HM-1:IMSS]|eukprot:XP_652106.1 hypothetical protein EHI_057840 [Entamoeba histolytica HM-1:IMSS]
MESDYYTILLQEIAYESCEFGIGIKSIKEIIQKRIEFKPTKEQWEIIFYEPIKESIELFEFYEKKKEIKEKRIIKEKIYEETNEMTIKMKREHHLYFLGYRDTSVYLSDLLYNVLACIGKERGNGIAQYDLLKKVEIDNRNITYYVKKLTDAGLIKKYPILKNSWKLVLSIFDFNSSNRQNSEDEDLIEKYENIFKRILEENKGKYVPQSVIRKALGLTGAQNKKRFNSVGRFIQRKKIAELVQGTVKGGSSKISMFWKLKEENNVIQQPFQINENQIGGIDEEFSIVQNSNNQEYSINSQMNPIIQIQENDENSINEIENTQIENGEDEESVGFLGREHPLFSELYQLVSISKNGATIRDISKYLKMSIKLATRITQFIANTKMFGITVTMEGKVRSKTSEYRLWLKEIAPKINEEEFKKEEIKQKEEEIKRKEIKKEERNENNILSQPKKIRKSTTTLNKERTRLINEIIQREGIVGLSEIRRELGMKENTSEHHKTIMRMLQPAITKGLIEIKSLKIPFENGGFRNIKVVIQTKLKDVHQKIKEYIIKCSKIKPINKKDIENVVQIEKENISEVEKREETKVKKYWKGMIKPVMIRVKTCFIEIWKFIFEKQKIEGKNFVIQENEINNEDLKFTTVDDCIKWLNQLEITQIKMRLMEFVENLEIGMFNKLIGIVKENCPFDENLIEQPIKVKDLEVIEREWLLTNKSWIKRLNIVISFLRDMRLIQRDIESDDPDGMVVSKKGIFFIQNNQTKEITANIFNFNSLITVNQFWVNVEVKSLQFPVTDPITQKTEEPSTIVIEGLQNLPLLKRSISWHTGSILTKPQRAMIYDHIYNEHTEYDEQKLCEETGFSEQQLAHVISQFRQRCLKKKQPIVDKKLKIRKFILPQKKRKTEKNDEKKWSKEEDRKILIAYRKYWFEGNIEQNDDSLPEFLPDGILKKLTKKVGAKMKQISVRLKELLLPENHEIIEEIFDEDLEKYDDDEIIEIKKKENKIFDDDVQLIFNNDEQRNEVYKSMAMLRLNPDEIRSLGLDVDMLFKKYQHALSFLAEIKFISKDRNPFSPMLMSLTPSFINLTESKLFSQSFFKKYTPITSCGWWEIQQPILQEQVDEMIIQLSFISEIHPYIFPKGEFASEKIGDSSLIFYEEDINDKYVYSKGSQWYSSLTFLKRLSCFSDKEIMLFNRIKNIFNNEENNSIERDLTISIIINQIGYSIKVIEPIIAYMLFKKIIIREKRIYSLPLEQIVSEPLDLDRMTPWSKFDGNIDIDLFNSLIHRMKSFVFKYPSVSVENLCKKFPFAQEDTLYLLQYLVDEGDIEIRTNGLFEDGLYVFPKISSFF